jgi:hypothetical protein
MLIMMSNSARGQLMMFHSSLELISALIYFYRCKEEFTLFKRKHHCHFCLMALCDDCSPDEALLDGVMHRVRRSKLSTTLCTTDLLFLL